MFLGLIGRRESGAAASSSAREPPRVAREATASLLALLEDDQTKLEVRPSCIPCLVRVLEACARPVHSLSARSHNGHLCACQASSQPTPAGCGPGLLGGPGRGLLRAGPGQRRARAGHPVPGRPVDAL